MLESKVSVKRLKREIKVTMIMVEMIHLKLEKQILSSSKNSNITIYEIIKRPSKGITETSVIFEIFFFEKKRFTSNKKVISGTHSCNHS